MVIGIVVGLVVWFVVPLVYEGSRRRKKKYKAALRMLCRIVGLAIIISSVLGHFL
ncbi:MAG: hypothetical protein ACI350_08335 [Prevotella sp.]